MVRDQIQLQGFYGKSTLDWVVLTTAGIINVRNEWPLSSKELYDFTVEKYGLTEINNVRHYETKEIKNSRGVAFTIRKHCRCWF